MMNQPKKTPFKIKETTTREYTGGEVNDSNADQIIKMAYGGTMGNKYSPAQATPSMGYGGKTQQLQDGGMAMGPDHEEGGIPVVQEQTGEPVAEIEGGERVFSQEDTAMMEEAAMSIVEAMNAGDERTAQEMAAQLGFAVVNMIAAQEQNQMEQEDEMMEQPSPDEMAVAQAANQFAQGPEEMQTI